MSFSIYNFYRLNRRIVIWAILLGLLWLLRAFFGLIFLTFVIAFIAAPLTELGHQRLRLPYRLSLSLVYVVFVLVLASFVRYVVPTVGGEVTRLIGNLGNIQTRLIETKTHFVERYPTLRTSIQGYLRSALDDEAGAKLDHALTEKRQALDLTLEQVMAPISTPPIGALAQYYAEEDKLLVNALTSAQFDRLRSHAPSLIKLLYAATATVMLAMLFSYLILIDYARLRVQVKDLKLSRLKDFYAEAAKPVVRFAVLVGRAIEAQAVIACINTALTLGGMLLIGLPSIAMLSLIVFVCSFIPVLGAFVSTTPMVLVALNAGGLQMSLWVVVLVIVIHLVEAYLLNPMIYGRHLKLNPVLTLIILFVGYHGFGLWGMLLGVPVARYFIHDVLGVPLRGDDLPPAEALEPAADLADAAAEPHLPKKN